MRAYMYSYPHKSTYGELNLNLFDYFKGSPSEPLTLYVHLPFCNSRCGYCNLFSVTGQNNIIDDYLDAIQKQIEQYSERINLKYVNNIVIGGGSPLVLSDKQLERLFKILPNVGDAEKTPICIEASPLDTTPEKVTILKEFNVQRVSLGVQSFLDIELRLLKREHMSDSVYKALELLFVQYNFPIVNIDLIYGLPLQIEKSVLHSLEKAISYNPTEIYLYPLYVRKGTKLEGMQTTSPVHLWNAGFKYLKDANYLAKSMRRFVRHEEQNRQNNEVKNSVGQFLARSNKTCGFEKTIALGCGGRSYLENLHFCSPYSTDEKECLKTIHKFIQTKDFSKITHGILLNTDELKRRYIISNLLHVNGLSLAAYLQLFGTDVVRDFPILNMLVTGYYARLSSDGYIKLTHAGLASSDEIGPMFISPDMAEKMSLDPNRLSKIIKKASKGLL